MCKEAKIILLVSFIMLTCQGKVDAFNKDSKEVTIKEENKTYTIQTKVNTVEELLEKENIILEEHDYINKNLDDILLSNENNEIILKKGMKIKVLKDGKEEDFWTLEGSVPEDIVQQISKEKESTYMYDENIKDICLTENQILQLYNLEKKEISETKNIPFSTEIVYNKNLPKGKEKILNTGKEGKKSITFEIELLDGEEIKRTVIEENLIENATNCLKEIGTKEEKICEKNLSSSNMLIMRASAYSAKQPELSNKTATGRLAVKGVVAVDPRVIPLGTKLYIEGYGNAIAADTGGAIKGNRIDLCYNTVAEALKFGRRTVKVYFIK